MVLEVFFDYACPYCLQGYNRLTGILPEYPEITVVWHPCEAHPRPERYGLHSDLCARGMYAALAQGADLPAYHEMMFRAALTDRVNIEDPNVLAGLAAPLLDEKKFLKDLQSDAYTVELARNNQLAWGTYGFSAVPSLRLGEGLLGAKENIGLSAEAIAEFLDEMTA